MPNEDYMQQGPNQDDFDMTIGRLDRVLSKLVNWGKAAEVLDDFNKQTLKHHAEDMISAGEKILSCLQDVEGTPQPATEKSVQEGPQAAACGQSSRPVTVGACEAQDLLEAGTQLLRDKQGQGNDSPYPRFDSEWMIRNLPEGVVQAPGHTFVNDYGQATIMKPCRFDTWDRLMGWVLHRQAQGAVVYHYETRLFMENHHRNDAQPGGRWQFLSRLSALVPPKDLVKPESQSEAKSGTIEPEF